MPRLYLEQPDSKLGIEQVVATAAQLPFKYPKSSIPRPQVAHKQAVLLVDLDVVAPRPDGPEARSRTYAKLQDQKEMTEPEVISCPSKLRWWLRPPTPLYLCCSGVQSCANKVLKLGLMCRTSAVVVYSGIVVVGGALVDCWMFGREGRHRDMTEHWLWCLPPAWAWMPLAPALPLCQVLQHHQFTQRLARPFSFLTQARSTFPVISWT